MPTELPPLLQEPWLETASTAPLDTTTTSPWLSPPDWPVLLAIVPLSESALLDSLISPPELLLLLLDLWLLTASTACSDTLMLPQLTPPTWPPLLEELSELALTVPLDTLEPPLLEFSLALLHPLPPS